jgi:hypothetical protein
VLVASSVSFLFYYAACCLCCGRFAVWKLLSFLGKHFLKAQSFHINSVDFLSVLIHRVKLLVTNSKFSYLYHSFINRHEQCIWVLKILCCVFHETQKAVFRKLCFSYFCFLSLLLKDDMRNNSIKPFGDTRFRQRSQLFELDDCESVKHPITIMIVCALLGVCTTY